MHLCASCSRHVKQSPCPFCGCGDRTETRGLPAHANSLSRAQLVAGAALIGAVAACGGNATPPSATAVYGAPAPEQAPHVDFGDAGSGEANPPATTPSAARSPALAPQPTMQPMYGMPPG